ncbi:MAG: uracil phosphoribosyltransferase [Verrucomicrobiota bacterium]|nr:uracil phosphoribosyltransferase [Verrucomicrobiota bacterium]
MKEALLNRLRDRDIPLKEFRQTAISLSALVASEIYPRFQGQKVVLNAILRAGLSMLSAFQEKFMHAPIGLIGIRRDEKTVAPHLYYEKIPPLPSGAQILRLDPMLATGGSTNLALNLLKARGAVHCTVISLISAPEGQAFVKKNHPGVSLYTVALDRGLDDRKFIVPGLGDFGDRYFGTH